MYAYAYYVHPTSLIRVSFFRVHKVVQLGRIVELMSCWDDVSHLHWIPGQVQNTGLVSGEISRPRSSLAVDTLKATLAAEYDLYAFVNRRLSAQLTAVRRQKNKMAE